MSKVQATKAIKELTAKTVKEELLAPHGKKFEKWCKYFLEPDSETYGNATKSALRAYNAKNYFTAGSIGSENLKKLKNLGLTFAEQEGMTVRDWYKILATKAVKGTYEQTKDFMHNFNMMEENNIPQNQNNFQFNFGNLAEAFSQARKERGLDIEGKEDD